MPAARAWISALLLLLRNSYWIGTGCFGAGALLTVGAGVVFGTGVIHRFVLKEAAVYAVVTGTMTALTTAVLVAGIVLLAIGVVLLVRLVRRVAADPTPQFQL